MGGESDNVKGLALAISSSVFIGSSFIVKKKGLKKAGANGTRAGTFFPPFSLILLVHFLLSINNWIKGDLLFALISL